MAAGTLWSALIGGGGAALGVIAKSAWDRYYGWQSSVPIETWKLRAAQMEKRLSQFYWPLYIRLQRDDVIWEKVFGDLRGQRPRSDWAKGLGEDRKLQLAREIESTVILPNHASAADIIRANVHVANADETFSALLASYVRHVDVYTAMRNADIWDIDPLQLQEPYPQGLSEAVHERLVRYQAVYEGLLREKGVLDLSNKAKAVARAGLWSWLSPGNR